MPQFNLKRFLSARSIAVYGGAWAENVIQQLQKSGFSGEIWPVHPKRNNVLGVACFANTSELPASPDAAFIGVNRELTIQVLAELSAIGAGGAICFASGFRESGLTHDKLHQQSDDDLQAQLIKAAGSMPVLGPNCYGFLNYLDNVCIWPDQHGGRQVDRGVAVLAQSSNIAINMTMQKRGLAISHMITLGNQAKVGMSDVVAELLSNPKVSAIGLYLEGFGDLSEFQKMAEAAQQVGKPIVAIKIGKSEKAQAATLSHTASLAGSAAASSAFLQRLGIVEVDSIATFLETLKILDLIGPLLGNKLSSTSCSGGEASLMADLAEARGTEFAEFSDEQVQRLTQILGGKVDIANPLDYHTYIWGDVPTMTQCFEAVVDGVSDLNVFVLDVPREDVCDVSGHECAIEAIINAKKSSGKNIAVISCLSENLEPSVTQRFIEAGVVPFHGMVNGLKAIQAAMEAGRYAVNKQPPKQVIFKRNPSYDSASVQLVNEYAAKSALNDYGLETPQSIVVEDVAMLAEEGFELQFPVVLKGLGLAHKTEAGAVKVGITSFQELMQCASEMPMCPDGYMIETMVDDVVAELLVGISFDPTGLALLTIGAGGIYTELLDDAVSLMLPVTNDQVFHALQRLKISKILAGYRGKPAANLDSVIASIQSVAKYAQDHVDTLIELDINPLMAGQSKAVAVDAMLRTLPQN